MAALLFLRLPHPAEYMTREINALQKRLPEGRAPTFHTDKTLAFLLPWDGRLDSLLKQIRGELNAFDDWDLMEVGRENYSKRNAGTVETWFRRHIRWHSGPMGEEPNWDGLAEWYRTH
jgi:hypothetical protein